MRVNLRDAPLPSPGRGNNGRVSDDPLMDDHLLPAAVRAVLPRLGELVPVDHDRVAADLRRLLDGSDAGGGTSDGGANGPGTVADGLRRVLNTRPAAARWVAEWIETARRGRVPVGTPPDGGYPSDERVGTYDGFLTPAARPILATLYYCSLHPALPSQPRRGLKGAVPRCPECRRPLVRDDR